MASETQVTGAIKQDWKHDMRIRLRNMGKTVISFVLEVLHFIC